MSAAGVRGAVVAPQLTPPCAEPCRVSPLCNALVYVGRPGRARGIAFVFVPSGERQSRAAAHDARMLLM